MKNVFNSKGPNKQLDKLTVSSINGSSDEI